MEEPNPTSHEASAASRRPHGGEPPPLTRLEPLLDAVARLALVAMLGSLLWIWPRLPEEIPRHFGFDGRPDAWGGRGFVLIVPVLAFGLYAMFAWFIARPHLFNFPWPVDEDTAPRQMRLARELLRAVRAWTALVFGVAPWLTWRVASGAQERLDPGFLPLTLGMLAVIVLLWLVRLWRAR